MGYFNNGLFMRLTTKDYKQVLDIIDLLYSIHDRTTVFQIFFEQLQELLPASCGGYFPMDPHTMQFHTKDCVLLNAPFKLLEEFLQSWINIHPIISTGYLINHTNEAIRMTDIIPAYQMSETEYSKEFQSRTNIFYEIYTLISVQGDPVAAIGLNRPRGDHNFTNRDLHILNMLIPHLGRVLHNLDLFQTITSTLEVGLIIIQGADSKTIFMNEVAKRALNGDPIQVIPDPGQSVIPTYFKASSGMYRVRTVHMKYGKREKIILMEPFPTQHNLQLQLQIFGLTPRQQEVALLVIRGFSNRVISEKLYIAEQTVKDHLQDVFEAIQVHSRSELIAKVTGLNLK